MLEWLNLGAALAAGLFRLRFRSSPWMGTALSLILACNVLLLGRVEGQASFELFGLTVRSLELIPIALIPLTMMWGGKHSWFARQWVFFMWATLLVAFGSQLFKEGDWSWTLFSLVTFLGPMLLGVQAARLDPPDASVLLERFAWLLRALALVTAASVISGTLLSGSLGWSDVADRAISPVGGSIATGAVLLLLWPLELWRCLTAPTLRSIALASLVMLGIILSGSRVVVATGLVATFAVVVMVMRARGQGKLLKIVVGCLAALLVMSRVTSQMEDLRGVQRLTTEVGSSQGDLSRIASAETALALISDGPLLGGPPGEAYPWFRVDWLELTTNLIYVGDLLTLLEPHNMYLMMAVEYGVPITILFLLLMLGATQRLFRRAAELQHPPFALMAIGLLGFLVQALASSHLIINHRVAVLFWIFVGLSAAASSGNSPEKAPLAAPADDHPV